ncbi:MAG: HAMP domain-containing sensor histidine kinase [Saprospiraceae bacterium]|nr:HAMP domain-containing sensor histidine kinase [Saprospiraceae bacterium]
MENKNRFYIIALVTTAYILLAFGWWSMLLMRKNEEAKQANIELLRLDRQIKNKFVSDIEFTQSIDYQIIIQKYERQAHMVWGEGSILFMGLFVCFWMIQRSLQKEVELNSQRRNFLLSVTHELKSPIASIRLILQTFQKRKLDEAQRAKFLNAAVTEADRLHELVDNLLLSSRLDSTYEGSMEEINVAVMLDELIEKCRVKFPRAHLEFNKNEVPILIGDRQGLVSLFTNLLENAAKYSGENAEIKISQKFVSNKFHFEIADNGVGIPASEKKKVFEKFYRVGSELTRRTKGTGLGLFIVAQIVKLHNGLISVSDNTPKGTIFKVTLPIEHFVKHFERETSVSRSEKEVMST